MSFLAPLYLAGIAAIGLPILFHMIRRTPKGHVPFSTLMFLEATPPKVTKRSNIEHWLLLCLRAAALILLACAFSRPFLRSSTEQAMSGSARRVAILIDVSASMKRAGLWEASQQEVEKQLSQLRDKDQVGVFSFDESLSPIVSFDEWAQLDKSARQDIVKERLTKLKTGWRGTDLGKVLPSTVTSLLEGTQRNPVSECDVVLISDMQRGARFEGLQGYSWPDSVVVTVPELKAKSVDNAGIHVIGSLHDNTTLRLRVDNAEGSQKTKFNVRVEPLDAKEAADKSQTVNRQIEVPKGQSRVVAIENLESKVSALKITLSGDGDGFDNQAWHVRPEPAHVMVEYLGDGGPTDPEALRYYVQSAFLSTPQRIVDFITEDTGSEFATPTSGVTIVAKPLEQTQIERLQKSINEGRRVLCVGASVELCQLAFHLAKKSNIPEITEANVDGYAMLSDVDFEHPLFSPFNNAKLADFSKLAIWKHRDIPVVDGAKTLARFDNGEPAVIEMNLGKGSVVLFAFGWHGSESKFVLWSKYVPLVNSWLNHLHGSRAIETRTTIGQPFGVEGLLRNVESDVELTLPSGNKQTLKPGKHNINSLEPGVIRLRYEGSDGPRTSYLVANLDPLESRTERVTTQELKTFGIPLERLKTTAEKAEQKRMLQSRELESEQRVWQWLIVAGVVILLFETWLAGRMAQQSATPSSEGVPS
jgi:hypothetical protein